MSFPKIPAHDKRAIAVRAMRDPRSVDSVLEGRAKPLVERAIRDAARDLGIELPPPRPLLRLVKDPPDGTADSPPPANGDR